MHSSHTRTHRVHLPTALRSALLAALFCATSALLHAQWTGDGTQRLEGKIVPPDLQTVPELHTDMSWDCLIGYIAMDSIGRTQKTEQVRSRSYNTTIDSLRVAARFAYAVADYNPVLLRSFIQTSNKMHNVYQQTKPVYAYSTVQEAVFRKIHSFGRDYSMLLLADYVYRVRVTDVVTGTDTLYSIPKRVVNVACRIEEVFKGQHWVGNCNTVHAPAMATGTTHSTDPLGRCLIFHFLHNARTGPLDLASIEDTVYTGIYTTPQVDEEYIVFLDISRLTEEADTITPLGIIEATGGLFRITDGMVADPSNIWGLGTSPALTAFRQRLTDRINDILHWTVD